MRSSGLTTGLSFPPQSEKLYENLRETTIHVVDFAGDISNFTYINCFSPLRKSPDRRLYTTRGLVQLPSYPQHIAMTNAAHTPIKQEDLATAETWIFDLDNTLYPAACGLFSQVEQNMTRFIMERLELARDDAYAIQKTYFREHGTTMRGLMHHHGTDPVDFLDFVHNIDLSPIPMDHGLDDLLSRLSGRN